ncbi:MAG TPA: UDP-N-acetylglucosamine--N-acetylmuramyl-(pentapeptide) pyrophosphoryl-undecaprenol N-acetylglucosamine transferase [Patescibacteria group bacterium]|nr:UDP-N-acetylglucosamine--N-acetylmuramyl-(pentapeptide) pyrophosphoryl-undecaprenol N-acetylglucosamine transferase [Patescibacteria group bacterium]
MKIAITAGGGGHFASALAVIESLQGRASVTVIGRKYALEGDLALSFEYQMAEALHIPFISLKTGRLQRKISPHTFLSLLKVPSGLWHAHKILRELLPDVLVSFGGYVAFPVVLAAFTQRIPIVLHEQTLEAGLANRLSTPFASKICVSWRTSESFFPKNKTIFTGLPLRKTILRPVNKPSIVVSEGRGKSIYITGGSSGAHAINVLIEKSLDKLLEKYILYHQTGDARVFGDFERLSFYRRSLSKEKQQRYFLSKFLSPEDAGWFLSNADLVICRSGMNTVSELLYYGKPCLLIPLPYGQRNEQKMNASLLYTIGIAEVVNQQIITPEMFLEKITTMMHTLSDYKKNATEAKSMLQIDATEQVIQAIYDVKKKK